MEKEIRRCHKCGKEVYTFFANRIPLEDDPTQYKVDPEYICPSCMCEVMGEKVKETILKTPSSVDWFPIHGRISLEFEDERYGSFNVRVYNADELVSYEDANEFRNFAVSGRMQIVIMADCITKDEQVIFVHKPRTPDRMAQYVASGMKVAIDTLYGKLKGVVVRDLVTR